MERFMEKQIDLNVLFKGSLLFALGFFIVGFASEYAIVLGILGGGVAGFIAKGWNTKEIPKSDSNTEGDLIRSVKKIRERFVRLGTDSKPSNDSASEAKAEDNSDPQAELSALKKTKQRPEMGWFGVKYKRQSRR